MPSHKRVSSKKTFKGCGLVSSALKGIGKLAGSALNTGIDLLPWELHLPGGYRYCGPGTRLKERLARGDPGINPLDEACKTHDIAYAQYSDTTSRARADRELAERAWRRFKATESSVGEKAAAWAVTTAMKAKAKLGGGRRKKRGQKKKKDGKGLYLKPWATPKVRGAGLKRGAGARKRRCKCSKKKKNFEIIRIPKRELSNFDLVDFAKKLKIPHFRGVYMIDTLPRKPKAYESAIVNLDSTNGRGTHWVAYKKNDNNVYYFDSFGNLRPPPEITRYFGHGADIMYNTVRKQGFDSVECGRQCLLFLSSKHVLP